MLAPHELSSPIEVIFVNGDERDAISSLLARTRHDLRPLALIEIDIDAFRQLGTG